MAPWNEVYIDTRRYVVHIAVRCVAVMVDVISYGFYSSPVGGTTVISSGETPSKCWSTNQTSVSSSETVRAARQTTHCQFGERKTFSLSLSFSLSLPAVCTYVDLSRWKAYLESPTLCTHERTRGSYDQLLCSSRACFIRVVFPSLSLSPSCTAH